MNTGHCKFFYNKGAFVQRRFSMLVEECKRRGRECNLSFRNTWVEYPDMFNDYRPTDECIALLVERITLRMPKHPRYYGSVVTADYMTHILREGVKH